MDSTTFFDMVSVWVALILDEISRYGVNIFMFAVLAYLMFRAHKAQDFAFNVFDYFMDPATKKASITRTMQVIAGLTATWIIVTLANTDKLTLDYFLAYIGAMGLSEAWSKYIGARFAGSQLVQDQTQQQQVTQDPSQQNQTQQNQ